MRNEKINWTYYPKNGNIKQNDELNYSKELAQIPEHLKDIVNIFNDNLNKFSSKNGNKYSSNKVLAMLGNIDGYLIEKSKKGKDLIKLLSYESNTELKQYESLFCVDAYNQEKKTVIEVEAGRAYVNNQFLKDFFEGCVSSKVDYLVIAVRNVYGKYNKKDYEYVNKYFTAMYYSNFWSNVNLDGLLIIGY